eukprot:6069059-Amphidinium_carterae.1
MAFRQDDAQQPTSTSSIAVPQKPRSPQTCIGMILQVMEVMQTLGLKILSLHEKDHSKGSTDGEEASSSTPAASVEEQGYKPTDDP